jgi:hypothetical protein
MRSASRPIDRADLPPVSWSEAANVLRSHFAVAEDESRPTQNDGPADGGVARETAGSHRSGGMPRLEIDLDKIAHNVSVQVIPQLDASAFR